jgi:hypothetical protein
MKKWPQDGNLLEGEEMLAIHQSNPKINHFVTEKGNNGHGMETS